MNIIALKLGRESREINGTEMAKKLGISQSYYSKIELGKADVNPEIELKICEILDYPKSFFYQEIDEIITPISWVSSDWTK